MVYDFKVATRWSNKRIRQSFNRLYKSRNNYNSDWLKLQQIGMRRNCCITLVTCLLNKWDNVHNQKMNFKKLPIFVCSSLNVCVNEWNSLGAKVTVWFEFWIWKSFIECTLIFLFLLSFWFYLAILANLILRNCTHFC